MLQLPNELIHLIIGELPLQDVITCKRLCKRLYSVAGNSIYHAGNFVKVKHTNPVEEEKPPNSNVPTKRVATSVAFYDGRLFVLGGNSVIPTNIDVLGYVYGDLYSFDTVTNKWTKIPQFSQPITEHSTVVYKKNIYTVGGSLSPNFGYTSNIYKFSLKKSNAAIKLCTNINVPPRAGITATLHKNKIFIFGGGSYKGTTLSVYNDLIEYNIDKKSWSFVTSTQKPLSRCSHMAALYKDEIYVFGGYNGEGYLNDMLKYNIKAKTWVDITKQCVNMPPPRSRSASVVYKHYLFILGGWYRKGYYADFWCFDFETLAWKQIANPRFQTPNISLHSMDVKDNILYVFGGYDATAKEDTNTLWKCNLDSVLSYLYK